MSNRTNDPRPGSGTNADRMARTSADAAKEAAKKTKLTDMFGGVSSRRFCTFDARTKEGIALLDKCDITPDANIAGLMGMEVILKDFLMHDAEKVNIETGEVAQFVRTCLVTTDGEVYATTSDGIRSSVMRLVEQHGMPTWKNGVPVIITTQPTSNQRDRFVLVNKPLPSPPPRS